MTTAEATALLIATAAVAEMGCDQVEVRVNRWQTVVLLCLELMVTTDGDVVRCTPIIARYHPWSEWLVEAFRRIDQRTDCALSKALMTGGWPVLARDVRTPANVGCDAWR